MLPLICLISLVKSFPSNLYIFHTWIVSDTNESSSTATTASREVKVILDIQLYKHLKQAVQFFLSIVVSFKILIFLHTISVCGHGLYRTIYLVHVDHQHVSNNHYIYNANNYNNIDSYIWLTSLNQYGIVTCNNTIFILIAI